MPRLSKNLHELPPVLKINDSRSESVDLLVVVLSSEESSETVALKEWLSREKDIKTMESDGGEVGTEWREVDGCELEKI